MYIKTLALLIVAAALSSNAVMAECACAKNRAKNPLTQTAPESSIEKTLDFHSPEKS